MKQKHLYFYYVLNMNGVCKSCEGCVIIFISINLATKKLPFKKKFVEIIVPDQNENFLF